MANDRVYIRGKAVTCALGDEVEQTVAMMKTHRVRIARVPLQLLGLNYSRPYFRLPEENIDPAKGVERYFYDILFSTVEKAIVDAGLERDEIEDLPVFFGSTSNDMPIFEDTYRTSRHVLAQTASGYGKIVSEIIGHFGLKAAGYTFTTACTSSATATVSAAAMIVQGFIKRALVIGYDLFTNLGFYGFESLKLISPSSYKPFDKNREGIILGEGCGAFILDKKNMGPNDFYYLGGANICDISSVTGHNADGEQIAAVMSEALAHAGVDPMEVDAVKAHATGSYHNDLTEANGLKQVFQKQVPPVTALKPFVGHTLGACGVIELILFTEAVKSGFVPATLGFEQVDEQLNIEPLTRPLAMQSGTFLLNYFGFGGNCVSLVVSNKPE